MDSSPRAPGPDEDFDLVIEAGKGMRLYWGDIWRYRSLLFFLSWRDILVLYKQTAIGVTWAIIRPAFTLAIFCVIFGRIAKLPSDGVPYPILVFAGLLPWQLFASALSESASSLIANANLISKVYFPRILVPASAAASTLVDFAISFVLLILLMVGSRVMPTWRLVAVPGLALLALMIALGVGLWFSALNVKYRDFRYVVPFLVQLGLYASPVGFSTTVVPERYRLLYALNPMVGVIEGFRWAITGVATALAPVALGASLALALTLCLTGFFYFRSVERAFADVI